MNREEVNQLIDYYENLLTTKQREVIKDYYQGDFSLNEISQNLNISKSAVSDMINRVKNILMNYEVLLKLSSKHKLRMKYLIEEDQEKLIQRFIEIEKGE